MIHSKYITSPGLSIVGLARTGNLTSSIENGLALSEASPSDLEASTESIEFITDDIPRIPKIENPIKYQTANFETIRHTDSVTTEAGPASQIPITLELIPGLVLPTLILASAAVLASFRFSSAMRTKYPNISSQLGPITTLSYRYLSTSKLKGKDLRGHRIAEEDIEIGFKGIDFSGARLDVRQAFDILSAGGSLRGANLSGLTFHDTIFCAHLVNNYDFLGRRFPATVDFDGTNFSRSDLSYFNMSGMSYRKADFTDCYLSKSNFSDSVLIDADLTGAILVGANLEEANLTGANLKGANLEEANLKGTVLYGATLPSDTSGINFDGAHITKDQFDKIIKTGGDPSSAKVKLERYKNVSKY